MVQPQISLDTLESYGGSPKDYYLLEFFRLYEKYWDCLVTADSDRVVDIATGLLHATCPDKSTREKLWITYVNEKKKGNAVNASILSVGDLYTYLSDTLEFTVKATGGF